MQLVEFNIKEKVQNINFKYLLFIISLFMSHEYIIFLTNALVHSKYYFDTNQY